MNTVTILGNLTDDPELRYSAEGRPVANFSLAVSRRVRRDGEWTDQLDGYFRCVAFAGVGEHAAESYHRGDRVLVTGRLKQDRYEDKDGNPRSSVEIVASDVAASTQFATVKISKATSGSQQSEGNGD